MAIKPIVALPKGNAGMTLISSRNDDSTVSFPDIGFDFKYNGSPVRIIYSTGNTWIGFGTASEHLTINRKDTSVNNLYYKKEDKERNYCKGGLERWEEKLRLFQQKQTRQTLQKT